MSFCPKCGSTKGPFIDGFCEKCYLEDHELVIAPEYFELERCSRCGRVRIFGKWTDFSEKNLYRFFEKKVKLKGITRAEMLIGLEETGNEFNVSITVTGIVAGVVVKVKKIIPLRIANVICPSCGKLGAGYFEAKLQLRHVNERSKAMEKNIFFAVKRALDSQRESDPLAVITKYKILPSGEDIFIGSNKAARTALSMLKKEFNVKVLSTKKLVGRNKSGRNRYEFTYRLKL